MIAAWTEAVEAEQADICRQFFASPPAGEAAAVLRELAIGFAGDDDAGTRYLAAAAPPA
ncbi:hypothetical protein [Methanogenium cariaci]|uniref:hypothetical protein n=1 Tax=Methanogenium cariaci TaxID=2197 RepID=UPI00155DD435|nr:hypothetical protein [Methanogenium cariaci]